MQRYFVSFLSIYFFYFSLAAQQIWYFGNGAGLDFHSGAAKPIYSGKIFTLEGCATACDEKGHLLFYTDGITVWNKFHEIMPNGTGLNGSRSSTQSALIVPYPGNKGVYFLFTTDEKAGAKGFCYSSINILSNEGSVVKKNIQLLSSCTEQITAVRHENGRDIWVISHKWNSNSFYVFPVTEHGVGTPVVSSVGLPCTETGAGQNREAIGYLRVSPNGKKIASAICYRSVNNLEIFDFDNASGKVFNESRVTLKGNPYGLCFSPDNTKLYISFLKGKSGILQYELNDKSVVEIAENTVQNSFGGLKQGLDGKIYVARTGRFLDAIEAPNKKGILSRYEKDAIDLSPASSNFGLPSAFVSVASESLYFSYSETLNGSTVNCNKVIDKPFSRDGQLVMTEISVCENSYILYAKNPGAAYQWSTFAISQHITVDSSGIYRVAVSKEGCEVVDSVRIKFRKDLSEFHSLPAFDPSSGFVNSEFYYTIDEVSGFNLTVYNKKRKHIVFKTQNPNIKWNGKNKKGKRAPAGEYFWTVTYKPNCPKEAKVITQEGKVVLKREVKGKF